MSEISINIFFQTSQTSQNIFSERYIEDIEKLNKIAYNYDSSIEVHSKDNLCKKINIIFKNLSYAKTFRKKICRIFGKQISNIIIIYS